VLLLVRTQLGHGEPRPAGRRPEVAASGAISLLARLAAATWPPAPPEPVFTFPAALRQLSQDAWSVRSERVSEGRFMSTKRMQVAAAFILCAMNPPAVTAEEPATERAWPYGIPPPPCS
jgi:hypothetical protein